MLKQIVVRQTEMQIYSYGRDSTEHISLRDILLTYDEFRAQAKYFVDDRCALKVLLICARSLKEKIGDKLFQVYSA